MIPFVPPSYQTVFMALIGVWALAYLAGMILGKPNADGTRRLPLWAKITMIGVVLIIAGIGWLGITLGTNTDSYARWIFLGLLAGALGDLVLADVFPIKQSFLAGMGIFAIGHVFYLLAIFVIRSLFPNGFLEIAMLVVPSLFAAALLWEFIVRNPKGDPSINRAAFFYSMLVVITTVFAAFFPIRSQIMYLLGIGMGLFLISDGLLAQVMIKQRRIRSIHDVVWLLYSAGQLLIALSISEALRLLG